MSTPHGGSDRTLSAIPLTDPNVTAGGEPTIGALVRDASAQVSSLVRAEVELAKAETMAEVKKAATGSVFFIVAGVVLLYSSFFFFFFLADVFTLFMPRAAASGVVFLLMVLFAALSAFLGYLKVKKIRGPQKTIASVKEMQAMLTPGGEKR